MSTAFFRVMVVAAGADVGLATSAADYTPGVDAAGVGAILAKTNGFRPCSTG